MKAIEITKKIREVIEDTSDIGFDKYMEKVNSFMMKMSSIGYKDLPSWEKKGLREYKKAYEMKLSYNDTARRTLAEYGLTNKNLYKR